MESGVQAAFGVEVTVMCQLKGEKKTHDGLLLQEYFHNLLSIVSSRGVRRAILIFICIAGIRLCH